MKNPSVVELLKKVVNVKKWSALPQVDVTTIFNTLTKLKSEIT